MILNIECPICNAKLATINGEQNKCIRTHMKEVHPLANQQIEEAVKQIGELKDQIVKLKRDIKRNTGYYIPYANFSL